MPGRSQKPRQPRYFVGLDLGQQHDYTAICVQERLPRPDESGGPKLHIRHLERFRDTLYPDVAERVAGSWLHRSLPETPGCLWTRPA